METKVNIMDLEIDIISIDYLILNCKGFLTTDFMNIIYLVSTKTLKETVNDEQYKASIEAADFVLPGEETLLSLHHVDMLQTEGMIVDYHFLYPMFESISEEKKTMYIVGRNEKEINWFKEFTKSNYPNLKMVGSCAKELLEKEEIVINEINSVAPDILIFAIDSPFQEKWISMNYSKLNSKLCFGIGGVIDQLLIENKDLPNWVKKLRIQKIYTHLFRGKGFGKLREVRIFKKRVENYKIKKGVKNNENTD